MADSGDVLRTYELVKKYSGNPVVDRVSLTVKRGEIYGLIGKNGAGKTTFFRLVAGLIHPDGGEVELFGEPGRSQLARVGCMIETPALYPNLSAAQNLETYRLQQGIPDRRCVPDALELVGLAGTGGKLYGRFSLGMRQRLGLALAILGHPDFILLDEPANGLDPIGMVDLRRVLLHLNQSLGITLLVSSHLLAELSLLATTYGILHAGRLVKELTKDQLEAAGKRSLSLTVDDTRTAAFVLETVLGTTLYQVVDRNQIRLYDHLDDPAEVAYQMFAANVRVSSLHVDVATLEDVFRSLIGEAE